MTNRQKQKIIATLKLILQAGKATPAYPVGPTLGSYGLNIGAFVKDYNAQTAHQVGMRVPVEVTIFSDRSFSMRLLQPTTASLLRRAAGVEKGSSTPGRTAVGEITRAQLREIAQFKLTELNAVDLDGAERIIAGTARNMGIDIRG
jgi:large subunit ribosomal protein L11